jgi:hypothetical protein
MKTHFLLALFLLGFITGCAEKPKSVGNGLPDVDGRFTILVDTLYASGDTTYHISYAAGVGLSNLTGRLSASEEIITLINFLPGGTIDSLNGAKIDSVELRLTVNYRYLTQTPIVQFSVYEVKNTWSQTTFTSDNVPALSLSASPVGAFSDTMNFATVTKALITDTAAVRRWAMSYYDTSSAIPDFYGFAVRAPNGVNTGIVGFSTFSNYSTYVPSLFIRYTRNGRRDSMAYYSGEDTYGTVSTGAPALMPITVRGGFGIRSKVTFDHHPLEYPAGDTVNKPIINKAMMELTLDTLASSFGGFSPDTVTALLGMSNTDTDRSDSSVFVYGYRKAVAAGQSPVYSFNVTKMVDRWVQFRSVNTNYGITLRWAAEFGTAEKAVFYPRTTAETAKKPKLIVTYSKK